MIGSHSPHTIGSLALNNPPKETPSRQYIEFSDADRNLIQTAATLNEHIYKYSKDPSAIQPFLDQGWNIERDTNQERQQKNNQVLAQGSQEALLLINPKTAFQEQHTLAPKIREIGDEMLRNIERPGYDGQFLINERLGIGLLVNKGTDPLAGGDLVADGAILLNQDCQRNQDAIAFARECKIECERRGIKFITTGHSLGGYHAHLQKAVVGADVAIGFDNPLLSENVVKQYEGKSDFSISEIKNDSGYVSTRSNPNVIQQAGGSIIYGQELCVDVLKHEPISISDIPTVHSISNICKEVNAGQIWSKNDSFIPLISEASSIPLISEASSSTSRQQSPTFPLQPPYQDRQAFFENQKDDFHKRSIAAMEVQLNTMPTVTFNPETIPTEEEIAAIETIANTLNDRGDAQELLGIAAVGEQIAQEMESELKGETGEQKALKLAQAASEIAAVIYRDQQRSLAEQQQKIQQRQWERHHDAKKDRMNQKHDYQSFGLSLPAIESTVFRGFRPSGNMSSHLKSMQKNTKNYHKTQMKLNELLETRKNRKAAVDGQRKNLDDLDASIGRHYHRMMRSRQNSMNALGKASTAMSILGSILSFTPISPVVPVLAGIASTGLSIARTRHEKRLMKLQAQLQKKMEGTLNTREKIAEISYQTTQEITAIEREQLEQRRILLQSADVWSNPNAYRSELATSRAAHITETQAKHSILEERKQALDSLREQARSLKAQEQRCQNQVNKTKKRKYRERHNKTLEDVRTNLSQTRTAITTLEIEVESREEELSKYRETLKEMDSKIEQEEKLAPVKDYFHQIVSNQTKKWEVKNEELRIWQENFAKGFANFSAATEEERQFFHTTLSEIEKLFRELSSSPLTRGLSFLTGNNINLGRGALFAQNAARLGEEIYRTYDCFRRWSVAAQAFSKGIEASDKDAVSESKTMLMINNAIKKLGPHSFFIMQWIIPGMQTITAGLAVLRVGTHLLTGCQRTISPEEHLFRKLGIFLEKFSKHIDVQFKHFHDHLDRNQAELLETLNCVRSELSVLSNEILYEIEHSRDRILQQLRTEFFNQHTAKIKRTGNKISEKLDRFKLDFTPNGVDPTDRIEVARKFLTNHVVDLQNKAMLDVNTGVSYERNAQGLTEAKPLVDIVLAAQNPDLYTGAIASNIGFDGRVPSFFLFSLLAINDAFARKILSHNSFDIGSLNPLLEISQGLIIEQGQRLLELSRQLPSLFHSVRSKQDEIIRSGVERIALTQQLKQASIIESVRQIIRSSLCIDQLTNEEFRIGHHKFHMADLFCNTQIQTLFQPFQTSTGEKVAEATATATTSAMLFGGVGFAVGGPVGALVGVLYATTLGSWVGYSNCKESDKRKQQILFDNSLVTTYTIRDLFHLKKSKPVIPASDTTSSLSEDCENEVRREIVVSELTSRELDSFFAGAAESKHRSLPATAIKIWLCANGTMSGQLFSNLFKNHPRTEQEIQHPRFRNRKSSSKLRKDQIDKSVQKLKIRMSVIAIPNEPYELHKENTPFKIVIVNTKKINIFDDKSSIKMNQIGDLSPKTHTVVVETYNKQLKVLIDDYHEWLSSLTDTAMPESNRFHKITDVATIVPSSNPNLVPLAFPTEVLRQQENRMEPDRSLMEATGVGFLVPSYQFRQEIGKESYTLRIEYRFVETENPNNQTIYADFIVAEVDQNTVKAFSKPIFTKDDELPPPNLNEFLIQAMFCDFADNLGLPGYKSVSLGKGRWIAPAELPSGFFRLLEQSPTSAIHFDSREYTEALSQKATEFANGRLKESEELHRLLRKSLPNIHGIKIVVWKKIREAKEKLSQSKKALEDNYHTLWAYCRLLSSLDNDSLRLKLESNLGIIDPNQYDSLADLIAFGVEPTPVSVEDQMHFYTSLDTIPSTCLSQLHTTMREIKGNDTPPDYSDLKPYVLKESSSTHVRRKYIPDISTTEIINSFNPQDPLKLRNIGNSCYISSVLQSLLCVETLVEHLRLPLERKTNVSDDKFTKVSTIHQELLKFIGPISSPFPVGLRNAIFDYGHDEFSPPSKNQQKDAAVLMELLVDEFLPYRFSMAYHKTCDAFPGLKFIHLQEETTLQIAIDDKSAEITQLIGRNLSAHKMENRTLFEPREAIPPQDSDPIYVEDYILEHRLSNLPPVMVVHLKRFGKIEGKIVKINSPIQLPFDGIIDLSSFCETPSDDPQLLHVRYRIKSYVVHIGKELHEGHYENYIEKGGNYFHCNDIDPNFFNEISREDFLSRIDPYILVMERINEEVFPTCSSSV